jgi:PAS domain S-box-containing protein
MDMSHHPLERLREDAGLILYRRRGAHLIDRVLLLAPAQSGPRLAGVKRLEHEFERAADLDSAWALRPIALTRHDGQVALLLTDPGGLTLDRSVGAPMDLGEFLSVAIGISGALREVHARGLIHKDLKPSNVLVDEGGNVHLTGFGIATRALRERQAPIAPEVIDGTFQYMAPEQTGRTNRLIDQRSDLYSLGITLYEMLLGALPFAADEPLELIHSHIARLPPPPSIRADGVPPAIEAIILKLLAKNAEDRYQTAAGVEHDLKRFRTLWRINRDVGLFPLAERDRPDSLTVPQKLIGRESEVSLLTGVFEQVSKNGKFDLVTISGPAGVGKSAVIDELQPLVHAARGLFAAGKFDPQKRDIPYSTVANAFRGLLRHILSREEEELSSWREALLLAVGSSGRLLADLMPEISLILGKLAPPPLLAAKDEKARFQLIFRKFIGAFARPGRPLVLALDDLQWMDPASMDLLDQIAAEDETPNLLLVCGHRTSSHGEPDEKLAQMHNRIRAARGGLREIILAPLTQDNVARYVADSLQEDLKNVGSLAEVVFQKTQGNPLLVSQFLTSLSADATLYFERKSGRWTWNLEDVRAKAITDNVGDLMSAELDDFDSGQISILTKFSCLGLACSDEALSRVLGLEITNLGEVLRPFVKADLVHRLEHGYAFANSGVREAAYARLPAHQRPEAHLALGRLLARGLDQEKLEEGAFEVVNQFNRSVPLVVEKTERRWLADLNLVAGKRAKASTAYEAALAYFDVGISLLAADCWSTNYRCRFDLELNRAECKFILGDYATAEDAYVQLAARSQDVTDLAKVISGQMILLTYVGRSSEAIDIALDCLARLGVHLTRTPAASDVKHEYYEFEQRMVGRDFEDLIGMDRMTDPHWLEVIGLLEELQGPVALLDPDLLDLVLLRMTNITLDHGCTPEACHAFANLGARVLGWRFGSFQDGHRLARLAIGMIEDRGLDRYASRVYAIVSGVVSPWNQPLRDSYLIARRAIDLPKERGGIGYSGYAWVCGLTALLGSGERLSVVKRLSNTAMESAQRSKFQLVIELIAAQQKMIAALQGEKNCTGVTGFSDEGYEAYLESGPTLVHAFTRYYIRKLQFLVYAGRASEGVGILEKLGGGPDKSPILLQSPVFEVVEFCFFAALARAEHLSVTPAVDRELHFEALKNAGAQLTNWSQRCPWNIADRAELVAAEIARLEGRELDAECLYERAVRLARDQGFVQNEALANELAARFYRDRGLETSALAYLRNARECYELWGADAKVQQLDATYPLIASNVGFDVGVSRLQHFDLQALIGMYQAVSQEIVLSSLIERLMVLVVEHAGAVRGLLLLSRDGEMRIVAEAMSRSEAVRLNYREFGAMDVEVPLSMLNHAARTLQPAILDDACDANPYGADPYFSETRSRSVLCLPLVKQKRLVGVLYLENGLASHIFTPDRISLLQLLASQAAISIENAELFRDVKDAQERARHVSEDLKRNFDLMPVMAWRTDAHGNLELTNKRWNDYTGMSEAEAKENFYPAFHPDDVEKVAERWRHLIEFRTSGEVEARMRRFDGVYRSFLVRATPVRDETGAVVNWHGTNTDIEDLKRAEQAQEALAQVSRLTAVGELTVSIAHEVNQPLMAIVTNAASCVRWLDVENPNIEEARLAAERVIRDGHRAGDVIASIRALARKAPTQFVEVDINAVIVEALVLARNELDRHAIAVDTRLAAEAGKVLADRVQIQQVVLNLIVNGIEAMTTVDSERRALSIKTEKIGNGMVQVSVADTGHGLRPGDAERVFDAFFTTKLGGVGMGLSICRSIVESHGGRIAVADSAAGCTFSFQVPTFVVEESNLASTR